MMKNRRKALAAFLAAALVLGLVPGVALGADYPVTLNSTTSAYRDDTKGVTYTLDSGDSVTLNKDDTGAVTVTGVTNTVTLTVEAASAVNNVLDGLDIVSNNGATLEVELLTTVENGTTYIYYTYTSVAGSVKYDGGTARYPSFIVNGATVVPQSNAIVTGGTPATVDGDAIIEQNDGTEITIQGDPDDAGEKVIATINDTGEVTKIEADGVTVTAIDENDVVTVGYTRDSSTNAITGVSVSVPSGPVDVSVRAGTAISLGDVIIEVGELGANLRISGIGKNADIVDTRTGKQIDIPSGPSAEPVIIGTPAPSPTATSRPDRDDDPGFIFVGTEPTPTPIPVEIIEVVPEDVPRTGEEAVMTGFAMLALAAGLFLMHRRRS